MRKFSTLEIQFIEGQNSDSTIEQYKKLYGRTPEGFVNTQTVAIPKYTNDEFKKLSQNKLAWLGITVTLALFFVLSWIIGFYIAQIQVYSWGSEITPYASDANWLMFFGFFAGVASIPTFLKFKSILPHISLCSYLSPQTPYPLSTYEPGSELACPECNGSGTNTIHHEAEGYSREYHDPRDGLAEETRTEWIQTSPSWDEKITCTHCNGIKFYDIGKGLERLNVYLSDFNSKIEIINSKIPEVNQLIRTKNDEIVSYNGRRYGLNR